MPTIWGWFSGRPSHGAYYVNRYAPWLLKAVPYASRALPWAWSAYLVYRTLKSRKKE